ncbi:MAG: hypothetical protein IJL62_05595 [Clostridia bacterium]|nr:hypothetical protein [Clostridia bacterium]
MKNMKRFIGIAYFLFFGVLMTLRSAGAYIDAASGTYILSVIAGLFIAAGATVAIFWRKITFWFKKKKALRAKKQKEKETK